MLSLRQLEYLVAVADAGRFGVAAKRCGVSQPALSKQVRLAEEELGATVFERTRPRVLVTPAGEEVLRRARRLLSDAQDLMNVSRANTTLRLGVIPTIAPYGLSGLLATLRRLYPQVQLEIHELQTDALVPELRAGGVDLALLARPFETHGFDGLDLVVEPFVLIAPDNHPLAARRGVARKELVGASLILMQDGHCLRDQAMDVCSVVGGAPPTTVAAASVSTLSRMVESGLGATLLPATALRSEVHADLGIVARSFKGTPPGRTLTLQWRSSAQRAGWFGELARVFQAHYLSLDETIPAVHGPRPRIIKPRGRR